MVLNRVAMISFLVKSAKFNQAYGKSMSLKTGELLLSKGVARASKICITLAMHTEWYGLIALFTRTVL